MVQKLAFSVAVVLHIVFNCQAADYAPLKTSDALENDENDQKTVVVKSN